MISKFIIASLIIASAFSWWDGGHMLTVEVAKQELMAKDPALYQKIERYVTILSPLCDARSQTFVQAASWADDIKTDAMDFFFGWHFIDKPENPQGLYIILDSIDQKYNSVTAVKRAQQELSLNYSNPIQNPTGISVQQAIFMRLLIHIVGDMHQPLHNANMYNYTYTTGDLGGNMEKITLLNNTDMNLHSYFDSGALRLDGFSRPLNDSQVLQVERLGLEFRSQYPRSYFGQRVNILTPEVWAQESFEISHNFIYSYIQNQKNITAEWDAKAYELIKQQIALGGYRLADFLYNIFTNNTSSGFTSTDLNSTSSSNQTIPTDPFPVEQDEDIINQMKNSSGNFLRKPIIQE